MEQLVEKENEFQQRLANDREERQSATETEKLKALKLEASKWKQALKEAEDQAFRRKMEKVLEYMEANSLFNMEDEKMDPIPLPSNESIPYTLTSPKIDTIKFSKAFS